MVFTSLKNEYNDNGCFIAESKISTLNGCKMVKDVKKNDFVATININCNDNKNKNVNMTISNINLAKVHYSFARVICVIKIINYSNNREVCQVDNLLITPWHPILYKGIWTFPANISRIINLDCHAVYNFVLDNGHMIMVDKIWAITLGHGYNNNILYHEYYGTEGIINDLKKITGWESGLITINSSQFVRDVVTNNVIGIKT